MKTIGTCGDCEHWTEDHVWNKGFGKCSHPKVDGLHFGSPDSLQADDYDGGPAKLETGKDFGCIHWKAKPSPTPTETGETP